MNNENNENNENNSGEHSALMKAVTVGNKEKVVELLRNKDMINTQEEGAEFTPLIIAILTDNEEIVKLLIENKVNVNLKDKHGNTALICASFKHSRSMMELLLKNGADINYKNTNGENLLFAALNSDIEPPTEFLKFLITEKSVKVNETNKIGNTPLMLAVHKRYILSIGLLLENGANSKLQEALNMLAPYKTMLSMLEKAISEKNNLNSIA